MAHAIIHLPEVKQRTELSGSEIYLCERLELFPQAHSRITQQEERI